MTKKSSLNGIMLVFSIVAGIAVFVLGELMLAYLPNLPFILQCAIYLTLVAILCLLAMYISEKVSSGYYIPRGRVIFDNTCAKAAAIIIPCAFVLGLLTQLAYGQLAGTFEYVDSDRQVASVAADDYAEGLTWWIARPMGPGISYIGTPLGEVMPPHPSMQDFFESGHENLHSFLDDFVTSNDVLGANGTIAGWLDSRSPTTPERAPSFLAIGEGDEALAFRAAIEYAFGMALSFNPLNGEAQVRSDYDGSYGQEYLLLWQTLDTWTQANHDACNNFYLYWAMHIEGDPLPLAPALRERITQRPHLLLQYYGAGKESALRIVLQVFLLSLWGIFMGIATAIFLNNNKLFKAFVIPRAIVSIAISAIFALVLVYVDAGFDISMPARALLPIGTCLLYLPTYSWNTNV